MTGLWLRALFSGIFFGIWPLFMKHSEIKNPNVATMFMEMVVLAVLLPMGLRDMGIVDLSSANWKYLVLSAVSAAAGVLIFNGGIAKVPVEAMSTYIAIVIVVQVVVTAMNQLWSVGVPSTSQLAGFVSVGVGVYLLTK